MSTESLALAPGSIVDKLRIDRVLGQGAFGITYLVTDEVLGKSFALKEYVPHDHVRRQSNGALSPTDAESERRFSTGLEHFLQEGRTVAPLEHPNVVKVFRCFEANGTAYLLMPYYRGEALHKLLQRSGTLSDEEARALAKPLLNALDYIHQQGVIHQDIKPANIYIRENGDPILLDFGAAGQRLEASPSLRRRLGSDGYAAPEQYDARGEIGAGTDIYALAATLYRSISGTVPSPAGERRKALKSGQPDSLVPIEKMVVEEAFGSLCNAIGNGLTLDSSQRASSVRNWMPLFEQSGTAATRAPMSIPTDVEREGREWLPIILLGVFVLLISAVVVYLIMGDGTPAVNEPAAPPDETTEIIPEQPTVSVPSEEKARWQAALAADTAYAYQLFIQDFPTSMFRPQAQAQLDSLDEKAWEAARAEGTRSAIEAHLEEFPEGLHHTDGEIILNEFDRVESEADRLRSEQERLDDAAWETARAIRSVAAMDSYISDWPGGRHIEQAHELRSRLNNEANEIRAFEAADKINTIVAYQSYIDAFPGSIRVAQALERIDDLTLRPGKTFKDCAECPSMVVVPAGSYWQGSDEDSPWALSKEKPRRIVTFDEPFAVGVFEITMAQWDQCAAAGGCSVNPRDNGWGRGSRPVIMVSWNDVQQYVSWINQKTGQTYRLPSESEWEYVARAGEEGEWIGGSPESTCTFGNIAGAETGFRWQHNQCADAAPMETLPVGSLQPNAFGLHDVIGNVAEWTLDCMNLSYLDAPADGEAWGRGICSSRMTRGGSWFTGTKEVRLPARFNLKTGDRNDFTGFRLVRSVEDQ